MKILVSAYACEPGKGSEGGVGWNVVSELARTHSVWVITRENNRTVIEQELARNPNPGLRFAYHDIPRLAAIKGRLRVGPAAYHYVWQLRLLPLARRLHAELRFDLAHQLTFGSFRFPTALHRLGVPVILGPMGGAEYVPLGFWRKFGPRGIAAEALRTVSNQLVRFDWIVRSSYAAAARILAASPQMKQTFEGLGFRSKVTLLPQIAIAPTGPQAATDTRGRGSTVRALFVARMIHWKGAHLAVEALAIARRSFPGLTLTVLGRGPVEGRIRRLVHELRLDDAVQMFDWLPTLEDVYRLYAEHDIFVFPSLHESGGMAVLEAMNAELPVICFDWGGPGLTVTDDVGIRVPATGHDRAVDAIAAAMVTLARSPERRRAMGEAGRRRVRDDYSWPARAKQILEIYEEVHASASAE